MGRAGMIPAKGIPASWQACSFTVASNQVKYKIPTTSTTTSSFAGLLFSSVNLNLPLGHAVLVLGGPRRKAEGRIAPVDGALDLAWFRVAAELLCGGAFHLVQAFGGAAVFSSSGRSLLPARFAESCWRLPAAELLNRSAQRLLLPRISKVIQQIIMYAHTFWRWGIHEAGTGMSE